MLPQSRYPTLLVTGPRGGGKSSAVAQAASRLAERIVAVLSRGVYDEEGARIGIDAVLHPDGATIPLARVADLSMIRQDAPMRRYDLSVAPEPLREPTIDHGPYRFSISAFTELTTGLLGRVTGVEGIVIDEIGPLELSRSEGFSALLEALLHRPTPLILTVRPECLDPLAELCSSSGRSVMEPAVVDSIASVDTTVERIVTFIAEGASK